MRTCQTTQFKIHALELQQQDLADRQMNNNYKL